MGMYQTLGSNARFGVLDATNNKTIAAAGANQAAATQITSAVAVVTGATGANGVRLPQAKTGRTVMVYSTASANGLLVYPAVGDDINDGTGDAAVTIEARIPAWFIALDDTTWAAFFTANT